MIRITTKIGDNGRVRTLFFHGEWVTLVSDTGKGHSLSAPNLLMAGQNHLEAACALRNKWNK
jgi:hypothetical protein